MKHKQLKEKSHDAISDSLSAIFDNLPELISLKQVEANFHYSLATIYEWRSRPHKYSINEEFFVKIGTAKAGKLVIKREPFRKWITSRPNS